MSTTIDRPREQVFEYLGDIANHAEFTDHYLVDWHLTREDPVRCRRRCAVPREGSPQPVLLGGRHVLEVQAPFRIVERGRSGKYNRVKMLGVYEVSRGPGGTSKVTYTFETVPVMPSDRLMEMLGGRAWTSAARAPAGDAPAAFDPGGRSRPRSANIRRRPLTVVRVRLSPP